ncbi:hypothetical protein AKFMO35_00780 [Apilactobacillus kunkeei]
MEEIFLSKLLIPDGANAFNRWLCLPTSDDDKLGITIPPKYAKKDQLIVSNQLVQFSMSIILINTII